MRKVYQQVFKRYFYEDLLKTRLALELTQAKMAEKLLMEERSYVQLDHGKCACSGLTLAVYLIYCSTDPIRFLAELKIHLEDCGAYLSEAKR